MGLLLLAVCLVLTNHLVLRIHGAGTKKFYYDQQNHWYGICNKGNTGRQSPINIDTTHLHRSRSLGHLIFSHSWHTATSLGEFYNTGHGVQFTLDSSTMTTGTPVGNYQLLQFHFHWGEHCGEGSEHRINGKQAELEIHFVHQIIGKNRNPGKANAVVSVLADVDEMATISGIWEQLDPTLVPHVDESTCVQKVNIDEFLPTNRDYYYYEGSLTTPPCTESVQWFVLKNRIKVPAAYLTKLRCNIEDDKGNLLLKNFRDVQPINGRHIWQSSSTSMVDNLLAVMSLPEH